MDFVNISETEYKNSRKFKFNKKNKVNRASLSSFLPVDDNLIYLGIMGEFSIRLENKDFSGSNFQDYFSFTGINRNAEGLMLSRAKHNIYEGDQNLKTEIAAELLKAAPQSCDAYIASYPNRKEHYYWKSELKKILNLKNFLDELPINYGEFHVFDDTCNWYIVVFDDDPLFFIALNQNIGMKMVETMSNDLMLLPRNFTR